MNFRENIYNAAEAASGYSSSAAGTGVSSPASGAGADVELAALQSVHAREATAEEIRRHAFSEAFWAPVTWVPFVPAMGIVALSPLPAWTAVPVLGTAAAFVAGTWLTWWPRMLKLSQAQLRTAGAHKALASFEKLLTTLKEQGLARHELALAQAEDIVHTIAMLNAENPCEQSLRIESVAREVFHQMVAATEAALQEPSIPPPGARSAADILLADLSTSLQTLHHSLHTLQQQARLLDTATHPHPSERLSELLSQLQQETSIAENVMIRLQNDAKEI